MPVVPFNACQEQFEFSPNQKFIEGMPRDLNRKNYDWLLQRPVDDTIRVVFTGDCQRFYDESEDFVRMVNGMNGVDFVLIAGDISDFGLVQEFDWIGKIFSKMNRPYFGVIGNHDHVGNGEDVFRNMFGDLNWSFVYQDMKFILHNTNGREANFNGKVPDMDWLSGELNNMQGATRAVMVSHVPPYDMDFDQKLEDPYRRLLANSHKVKVSLHGHLHNAGDKYYYGDSVRYINSNSYEKRAAAVLDFVGR